jgi:hypothetical protein
MRAAKPDDIPSVALRRLVLTLLPVLTAGCGGGSSENSTQVGTQHGEQPPSKAKFVALADAICKNHQSRREDLESQASDLGRLTSKAKAREVAALLRKESGNRMAEVEELERQQPPPGDVATVGSILSLVRGETRVIDRWANAYDGLDSQRIQRLQIRLGLTAAEASKRALAYGFEVCGQQ